MEIRRLFKTMVEREASDLFLSVNSVPRARINGIVQPIAEDKVTQEDMRALLKIMFDQEHTRRKAYEESKGVDFIFVAEDIGRFRINVFVQRGSPALVARHVRSEIRSFKELHLPVDVLTKFCQECNGLVLMCGPAGSGKSTTIATMLENINQTQQKHIVTIEDPIEFLFTHKQSMINQRELDVDVMSYAEALKHVTQQSPDIIYIGNIRDGETMRAAINATELGTFVVSTFHTINAVQTITRMVNFFPPYLHEEVLMQLSTILKGIISLRLLPLKDGSGRVPAYETVVVTPTISRLIREGKITEIQQFIDEGELFGMQSFKKSLVSLVRAGLVDQAEAKHRADSRDEFDLEMKGIRQFLD
ncbi:MAG: type IV pilus twitching motility protein PilT [Candidatus Omnitrophota bacterium]